MKLSCRYTIFFIALFGCLISSAQTQVQAQTLTVIAGTGQPGYSGDGSSATTAQLNQPFGVVRGPDGAVYFCDTNNHVIRRIATDGIITTVAGSGKRGYGGDGGKATAAQLNAPYELRFDRSGNLYFVERLNHIVRRVDAISGLISTIAGTGVAGFAGDGGAAIHAQLNQPHSLQFDREGNLYIADILNQRIRVLNLATGVIETFAGTGEKLPTPDGAPIAGTPLNGPRALDIDAKGDLWLALREANAVLRFDMRTEKIYLVAGTGVSGFTGNGGPTRQATLSGPKGLSVARNGDVYFADTESHSIRKIDAFSGKLELVAGTGTRADLTQLQCTPIQVQGQASTQVLTCPRSKLLARPHGVFADTDGSFLIGDSETHRVLLVRP